jgi:hypothetical protein
MTNTIWKKVDGPSAGLVQQHYVQARLDSLHRRNTDLEAQISDRIRSHPKFKGMKLGGDKWLAVYKRITEKLQSADLTINFSASSWFANENTYESYTQLYERSGRNASDGTGAAQLLGNVQNPAVYRANVDDKITFHNLVSAGKSSAPVRGLMPGRQGTDRIREQMEFRAKPTERTVAVDPKDPSQDKKYADSTNKHFNPKTKQVFAALNYGRRYRGSNIDYGTSHMVLSPKFKVNALYYGGDTFYHADASGQTAYHVLGALIAHVKSNLLDAIVESCYFGATLPDNKDPGLMVEGHLFNELTFKGNIVEIALDAPAGSPLHQNAKKFAAKHGAKLVVLG